LGYDEGRIMLKALVKKRAAEIGFDLVGIAPVDAYDGLKFSREWVKRGFGGEMRYLLNPKRDDPRRILPSAQSVICVGMIYNADFPYSTEVGSPERGSSPGTGDSSKCREHGWISRYAWGTDYHKMMRSRLEELRRAIKGMAPGVETRVFVDTGPVVERAFARLSGIGWAGKNTCLINQAKGSWFFLGVMLTSLALEPDMPASDRCGTCTACLDACPTQALVDPYVMDASRCIAYLNIELKGSIPEEFRTAIGSNVVGCDICQDVCPWNKRPSSVFSGPLEIGDLTSAISPQRRVAATTAKVEFQPLKVTLGYEAPDSGPPPEGSEPQHEPRTPDSGLLPADAFSLFNPSLESLAAMTEDDFQRIFRKSPIKRVKYRGWLRNLCVVMGNSGDSKFLPRLRYFREHADPIVREHAEWAIQQIMRANHLPAAKHSSQLACST
jgi:epoxyqueuosine reductase